MPIKQPYMLKTVFGDNLLELTADPGEAFLVTDIFIIDPAANYLTVMIDRTSVGYIRCGGVLGSHVNMHRGRAEHSHDVSVDAGAAIVATNHQQINNAGGANSGLYLANSGTTDGDGTRILDMSRSGDQLHRTLLNWLRAKGIFTGFPVAEGQTFSMSGVKQANCIQMVEYQILEPADIKSDQPNGSASKEYFFINYGNCGASIQATASNQYTTSKCPAEFPDFPFGKVVPAKHEVELLGILGSTFAPKENDGTAYSQTKYLKMVKDRETLFDDDREGILFYTKNNTAKASCDMIAEGWSPIGNYTDVDAKEPFLFPEPLKFTAGDELILSVTLEIGTTGQALAIDEHEIGLITRVRRVE